MITFQLLTQKLGSLGRMGRIRGRIEKLKNFVLNERKVNRGRMGRIISTLCGTSTKEGYLDTLIAPYSYLNEKSSPSSPESNKGSVGAKICRLKSSPKAPLNLPHKKASSPELDALTTGGYV